MGNIQKTMTEAAQAANQSNGRQSSGPASADGKERSKMNALKHGKYATRPDPVKLLLDAGYGSDYGATYGRGRGRGKAATRNAEEAAAADETERARLRAEMVRCYAPRDDFARLQAEELADLKFELLRLERVKEVMWRRERELLEVEQRRRRLAAQGGGGIATADGDVARQGYISLPDSPAKLLGMRTMLGYIVRQADEEQLNAKAVQRWLNYLYGGEHESLCGSRLRHAAAEAASAPADNPQAVQEARESLKAAAASQLDRVEEQLAICLMEEGPLSEAGQAARLLEATSSRKWGWLRTQENFLRRSIDRKVSVLIELRYEDTRERLAASRQPRAADAMRHEPAPPPAPQPASHPGSQPASQDDGIGGASGPVSSPVSGAASDPAGARPVAGLRQPGGESPAPEPQAEKNRFSSAARTSVPGADLHHKKLDRKICRNQGTNPPCALESTNRYRRGGSKCGNRAVNSVNRESRVESRQSTAGGRTTGWQWCHLRHRHSSDIKSANDTTTAAGAPLAGESKV